MRKLLIVAPTFFPDTVVAGVRVTQWARHLPEFGWSPLILCRHRGHTATAEALAERLHPDVRVEYLGPRADSPAAAGTPGGRRELSLRGVAMQMLDVVSVPDALVWKWRALAGEAVAIARRWQPDVVLSSSTPHSIHVAGRRVAEATGRPWVADFRDPYLIDCRHQPQGLRRAFLGLHEKFERDIYRDAALCTHAIPLHARWASRRYAFARDKIRTLTNGIPAELLDEQFLQTLGRRADSARARIRAVGVLGQGAVELIAAAIRQLRKQGIDAEFQHVGYARDTLDRIPPDLADSIKLLGPVSHRDALQLIAGADVLLKHDDPQRAQVIGLSSKLFEYLATGRPIVAVNPTRPDWQLIERLPWCWCLENPAPQALADALRQAIAGRAQPSDAWLQTFRQQYNRRNQTRQLASWLDDLVARRDCR